MPSRPVGLITSSSDNQFASFSCYRSVTPPAVPADSAALLHTIVLVGADGSVDTSTYAAYGYGGTAASPNAALHTASYVTSTNSFYVGAGPGTGTILNSQGIFASGYGGASQPPGRGRVGRGSRSRL